MKLQVLLKNARDENKKLRRVLRLSGVSICENPLCGAFSKRHEELYSFTCYVCKKSTCKYCQTEGEEETYTVCTTHIKGVWGSCETEYHKHCAKDNKCPYCHKKQS